MRTPAVMAFGLLALGLAIAGCGDDEEDPAPGPTPDRTDDATGEVIDAEPILGEGSYECQGDDRLILTPDDDQRGITWTLQRA